MKTTLKKSFKRVRNLIIPSALILLYHRVEDVSDDPHLLNVSKDNFEKQIEYLSGNFKIISLQTLVENIKNKKLQRKSIVITFDDGYADNCYNALPILEKFQAPATIFATAGKINDETPFYWDKDTAKKDQGRALKKEELIKFSKNKLIEIGSHTMSHSHLDHLSSEQQEYEIKKSKKILEQIINKEVISFSYPFGGRGDFNKTTIDTVKKNGYACACANNPGGIRQDANLFTLPRHLVRNWELMEFRKKLEL